MKKRILLALFLVMLLAIIGRASGDSGSGISTLQVCPKNPDSRYDRQKILAQFADILFEALPENARSVGKNIVLEERPVGFSVWDLTDTSNLDFETSVRCIDFIDGHIYHFVDDMLPFIFSHIAILEKGKLRIFRSLNCPEGQKDYASLLKYVDKKEKSGKDRSEILSRVKNYRRYQYTVPSDFPWSVCRERPKIGPNPDGQFKRFDVYFDMARILGGFAPRSYLHVIGAAVIRDLEANGVYDNARATNFFVYDLTDPSNKQTTSNESIDFINGHVYHFAYLDAPYSYSHIGILENGKLKVFSGINCQYVGAKLEDVLKYLDVKLEKGEAKNDLIKRVKNYRKYGVYLRFRDSTTLRCADAIKLRSTKNDQ